MEAEHMNIMKKRHTRAWSPSRVLVIGFLFLLAVGTLLLKLPIAVHDGIHLTWIDTFFTATSALCVTGLTVVDTNTTFSVFGEAVIIVLIQVGGIGFMTVTTLIYMMLGKRISFRERLILQHSMNANSMEGIVRIMKRIVIFVLVIELTAGIIFTLEWSQIMPFDQALYYGIFHAISLFNNAGFDLFGTSFQGYVHDGLFNIVSYFLIISGSLGFIVLAELYDYPKRRQLSLHSKVVLTMTAILTLFGALMIFIFEYSNPNTLQSMPLDSKIMASIFQSVSTRSAGTSTLDMEQLRQVTQFFIIIMMFIGGSPGSAGGGIKTTTFAILLCAVYSMLAGREDVVIFRTRINREQIMKALTITLLAIMMVLGIAMMLAVGDKHPFLDILFDTTSAVATVGLSVGITPELTPFAKLMFCAAMFIGRLGPLTLAYALNKRRSSTLYRYPEGKLIIG